MKIDLLFPIFEQSDKFFKDFFASNFCKKGYSLTYYFYCKEGTSLDFIEDIPQGQKYVIRQTKDKFNVNDAFSDYLKLGTTCDVLLLGDSKVPNLNKLFEKCLERKNEGASIVHIKCRKGKFKRFFSNLKEKFLNLFISIFTNKKDKFNIISLGLIDKNILDIMKTLPRKACYLKNTNMFYGYEGRTIYIPEKTPHQKDKFWSKTKSLKVFLSSFIINLLSIVGVVFGAIFSNIPLLFVSIVLTLVSLSSGLLFYAKHIIEIRSSCLGATFAKKKKSKTCK